MKRIKNVLSRIMLPVMLFGLTLSCVNAATVDTVGMCVGFENSSHSELIKKSWGADCPIVTRSSNCLQLNTGSAAITGFLDYSTGGDITVFLDLKLTDIVQGSNSWDVCWLTVNWYDASQTNLGHSDILITGDAADWHVAEKTFSSPPTGTTQYKVVIRNSGIDGTAWVDNVSIISSGIDEYIDFESDWTTQLPNGWGTKTLVGHDTLMALSSNCLQMESNSSVSTDLLSYSSGDVAISLDLKLTVIVPDNLSYKKCWLTVNWYDTSQTNLGHSDILITGDAADWHVAKKTFTSPPTSTAYYKVLLSNAGTVGTVWIDNVSIISSGVNKSIDFESDDWTLELPNGWGTKTLVDGESLEKCREIPSGAALQTKINIPYQGDRIRVSLDLKLDYITPQDGITYKVCWVNVSFYDSDNQSIGHSDVLVTKNRADWENYEETFEIARNARTFIFTMFNAGSDGTVWVDNINIVVEKDGVNACMDSSFKDNLLYSGKWDAPDTGTDWNSTSLYTSGAVRKVDNSSAASEESALYILDNATVISPYMAVTSNDVLHVGTWYRSRDLSGCTDPGRVQLVYYDSNNQIIGHEDLVTFSGDNDWTCLSGEYTPITNATKVKVWCRILAGGEGEAWFDEVTLIKLENPVAYNPTSGSVSIDADNPATDDIYSAVWENISQGYSGRVLDLRSQAQLDTIKNDGTIKRFRIFDILQSGKVLDDIDIAGDPVYNWIKLDDILDTIVNTYGFTPLLTIETTPNQISTVDLDDNNFTNRYPPMDFDLWGRIVKDTLIHIIERYGATEVETWSFDIWNEPSSSSYWKGTKDQYLQIYDQALMAVENAEAYVLTEHNISISLQTGTMSAVGDTPWYETLFDYLDDNGTLGEVDFLSFHVYAGTQGAFSNLAKTIDKIKTLRNSYSELSDKPLFISEYNGCSTPADVYRDTQVMGSCVIKACRVALDKGIDRLWFYSGYSFYSYGSDAANKHFNNSCGMMTMSNIRKPISNAYKLMGKLSSGKRLDLDSSNEPIDGIAVLADDSNELRILLTTFDDRELNTDVDMDITVTVDWANMPTSLTADLIRIDETHANAHTKWEELGKPLISETTEQEWIDLRAAADLITDSFTGFTTVDGKITFTITMQRNSVAYLEFKQ